MYPVRNKVNVLRLHVVSFFVRVQLTALMSYVAYTTPPLPHKYAAAKHAISLFPPSRLNPIPDAYLTKIRANWVVGSTFSIYYSTMRSL